MKIGFAIDIDGVLVNGGQVIPQAVEALKILENRNIPYLLLSNGGGITEAHKAASLSKKLEVEINPSKVVLSHSPYVQLVEQFGEQRILVIGNGVHVANEYGFKNVTTPIDILDHDPKIYPIAQHNGKQTNGIIQIAAILVFTESTNWGRDIQLIVDLMRTNGGVVGDFQSPFQKQAIPIYFCNSDFIYSSEYPKARFTQGAFRLALETVYKQATGLDLESIKFGKPEIETYRFANRLFPSNITIFAIGDNPESDIKGANAFGWKSILVRTGVWNGGENSADYVCENILDAVNLVLSLETKI